MATLKSLSMIMTLDHGFKYYDRPRCTSPVLVEYWSTVLDVRPTLNQHWANVSFVICIITYGGKAGWREVDWLRYGVL